MESILGGLEQYLSKELDSGRILASRTFYGAPFLRLFLAERGGLDGSRSTAIDRIEASLDRSAPEYHWEFVQYATLTFLGRTGDIAAAGKRLPLRFKGTEVANWALLRAACTVKLGLLLKDDRLVGEGTDIALETTRRRQLPSGLIADQEGVRSLQYHAFSTMLLGEIDQFCHQEEIRNRLDRAIHFARSHILRDGSCIFLGRGQNQLFGYAAILRILAGMAPMDPTCIAELTAILELLGRHQRPDGSLPLVLSGLEPASPGLADLEEEVFAGWYSYNNYFDYLPFFAHFLQQSKDTLLSATSDDRAPPTIEKPPDWYDGTTLVARRTRYDAVVSRPQGSASNWMPQPFFGHSPTPHPIFGGEEYFPSTFHRADLPVPRTFFGISMARFVRSFWLGRTLVCLSPFGILVRRFRFDPEKATMISLVFPPWILRDQICLPEDLHPREPTEDPVAEVEIQTAPRLSFSHTARSAGGRYSVFTSRSPRTKITWHFRKASR